MHLESRLVEVLEQAGAASGNGARALLLDEAPDRPA